jgi:ubiquinone/menaquinone biosynthesis C-methylase UbiE
MNTHLENLLELIPGLAKLHIIDVGAGRGFFLVDCAQKGIRAVGLEMNPNVIKLAKKKAEENGVEIKIVEGRAENMPFGDGCFDFANCAELIEHVDNPTLVLGEIHRILVPGGMVYMSVHNRFGIYDKHFRLWFLNWMSRRAAEWYIGLKSRHKDYKPMPDRQKISQMHYFSRKKFEKLARRAGFSVQDIRKDKINRKISFKPLRLFALMFYKLLRPFYFSTFHFLLIKQA